MEDRRLHRKSDIGAIDAAAAIERIRREADLVIGDHMNGAAGRVAFELRHLQNLGHYALADERRIAVNQNRDARARASYRRGDPASAGPSPSTTGSTASRWLGLNATETRISLPCVER